MLIETVEIDIVLRIWFQLILTQYPKIGSRRAGLWVLLTDSQR